jgi:hypothetical protein
MPNTPGLDMVQRLITTSGPHITHARDLHPVVLLLRVDAAHVIAHLELVRLALARAEAMVDQPLALEAHGELIPLMRTLRDRLRTLGPIVESWDESALCLKVSEARTRE